MRPKKTSKKHRVLTRSLLWLLEKLKGVLDHLENNHQMTMPKAYYRRRGTIKKIYVPQYQIFHTGEKPKQRIVSIHKDYLRPIVRGKEVKPIEFGAKVNKFQIDGLLLKVPTKL